MEQHGFQRTDFHEILVCEDFIWPENSSTIKYDNSVHFTWKRMDTYDHISLKSSPRDFFGQNVVKNTKTHILWSKNFFLKPCLLCDDVEKYNRARDAAHDNIERQCRSNACHFFLRNYD